MTKKILFICSKFPRISETFIRTQIDYFVEKDYDVQIYSSMNYLNNDLTQKYSDSIIGFKNKYYKIFFFPKYFIKFLFTNPLTLFDSLNFFKYGKDSLYLNHFYSMVFFNKKEYDIIIAHFGRNGNVGAFLKKNIMTESKLYCMFHGYDIREGIKKGGQIYKLLFEFCNGILSISEYNEKNLKCFGAKNIIYHPNGIDLEKFKKNKTKNIKEIKILSVGRLVWEKGYEFALEGVHKLINNNPNLNIEYNIIGEGPLRNKLEEYIKNNNLNDKIILHGAKLNSEIIEYYNYSNIFLLSSVAEALPVVIMEAASCELPIIATNVGSIFEEVIDEYNGFLIESKNSLEINNKLQKFIDEPNLITKMGKNGRKLISEKYNLKKLNQNLELLFQK